MTAPAALLRQPEARTVAVALAAALFLVSWGLVHRGFYAEHEIVDTPTYEAYGERVLDGDVPYRDFRVEYPPGALPVFVLPAVGGDYASVFAWLMAACGVATVLVVARVRIAAAFFVAVSPLLVGSLVLSRFDLWPAMLTAIAVVALLEGRHRLGWGFLGAAVAAKAYPFVLVPLALAWTWRRGRLRDALAGLVVFAAIVLPFVALSPGGVWDSLYGQASRPLQIESLGAALATTFGHPEVVSGHGSQNLAGLGWLATLSAVVQVAVLAALWLAFARRPDDLARQGAAAVAAFVAFGKVLSPQFLVWLVPLVPLVRGRRGVAAIGLLAAALVLTQVWFPARYWDYVYHFDLAGVVLARDLALVGLVGVLALHR
jgi:uncharacterized membrane protein